MLQKMTGDLFSGVWNIFGIVDDILIAYFDE